RVVTVHSDGTLGDTAVFSGSISAAASYLPDINDHGDTAVAAFEVVGGTQRARFRLTRRGTSVSEDTVLSVGSSALLGLSVALNDLGFGATVLETTGEQRVLLAVPQGIAGIPAGVVEVARSGGNIISL